MIPRWSRRSRPAFTLIELIVASSVMVIALLGIYAVMQQALSVEEKAATQWNDRDAAAVAAEHLAQVLRSTVAVEDTPSVVSREEAQGSRTLTLTIVQSIHTTSAELRGGIERRRYLWSIDPEREQVRLSLQRLPYAGATKISPGSSYSEAQAWEAVPRQTVIDGLNSLSVAFRPVGEPDADWRANWSGPPDAAVARIRARSNSEIVERYVRPTAQAVIGSGGQS